MSNGRYGSRQHRGHLPAGNWGQDRRGASSTTTSAVTARGLGKRYGRHWALSDCTLSIPAGHVVGLVGPNGAGKTTLIGLMTGMLGPTTGSIEVLGGPAPNSPEQLARIGYVAQGTPTYGGLSVADHLRFGARTNPGWDGALAARRIQDLGLDPRHKAGKLSGGQRAQLALTLGLAKRPELLILDEPIASLDPLARREFLQGLMAAAGERELSIIMSSHLIGDLEHVCDYLVVLVGSRLLLDGPVAELLANHHLVTTRRCDAASLPAGVQVITQSHTDRQSTFLVRSTAPVIDEALAADPVDLEQLVLAYMGRDARTSPALEVQR
jgi:ABC-2 type transport system ATP-binding protein